MNDWCVVCLFIRYRHIRQPSIKINSIAFDFHNEIEYHERGRQWIFNTFYIFTTVTVWTELLGSNIEKTSNKNEVKFNIWMDDAY